MVVWDGDIIHGLIAAVVVQLIMYFSEKIMTLTEFVNAFLEGIKNMASLIFVILIAFTLASINEALGFDTYMIGVFTDSVTPKLLPLIVFLLCAFIAFTSCSFWALIIISTPIFVPLAQSVGINPMILIAGIMSGTALGSQCCFYSDAVFMTAAGTDVPNITQVRVAAPYVIIGVIAASIAFLVVGFVS